MEDSITLIASIRASLLLAAIFSSYYAEAFALLHLPKSSEAQARQTRERNTCLRYCANFAESPECELRLLSSSTKLGHPLVTPSSGRPGTPQAIEGTHAPAAVPNLQTYHRRRSGHLRENGRRRSVR